MRGAAEQAFLEPAAFAAHGEPECGGHHAHRDEQLQYKHAPARLRRVNALLAQAAVEQAGVEAGGEAN